MMSNVARLLLGSLVAGVLLATASPAEARPKGMVFIQRGEDIFVAGDGSLPPEFAQEPQIAGAQSGYLCNIFGVFWAYFSVDDCKPVVFRGDDYWDDPELAQAVQKAHPQTEMQLGMWQGYGKYPLGLAVLLGLGLVAYSKIKGDDDDDGDDASHGDDNPQPEQK